MASSMVSVDMENITNFNRTGWNDLVEKGIFSMAAPQQFGGSDSSYYQMALKLVELGEQCSDNGLMLALGAHIWAGMKPILLFGSPQQKLDYIPDLVSGKKIAAHCVTEGNESTTVNKMSTVAKKTSAGYVLSGNKTLITNAPIADVFLVVATTEVGSGRSISTMFIIDRDSPGLELSKSISKMGLNGAEMGSITLNDCFVSQQNILGVEGQGQNIFLKTMEIERSMILAPAVGRMKALLVAANEHLKLRREGEADISSYQYVQEKIVNMEINIETSRLMLFNVAHMLDSGRFSMKHAAMTKLLLSKNWEHSASLAMSVFGGRGYLANLFLETELRDAIGSRFYSGTDEIQKNTIFSFASMYQ